MEIIVKLMEDATKRISQVLPSDLYLDDNGWGDDRFRVCIYRDYGMVQGRPKTEFVTDYTFVYYEDDLEEDVYDQYEMWLDEVLDKIIERFSI